MFTKKAIVLGICSAFSATGCAVFTEQSEKTAWEIHPDYAVKDGARTPEQLYRLGRYYHMRVQYDRALAAYRQALERDPAFIDARNGVGVILAAQGRYGDAIREFEAALTLAPRTGYLLNNLGYAYLLRGSNERARQTLESAQQVMPGNEKTLRNLKLVQDRLGREPAVENAKQAPGESRASPPRPSPALQSGPIVHVARDNAVQLVKLHNNVYELQGLTVRPLAAAEPSKPAAKAIERPPAAASKPFKIEVSNGNGINGMAQRVAGHLNETGMHAGRLTNQLPFDQPHTEIQYREGYYAEAATVAGVLAQRVPLVASNTLRSDIHVRLLLGKDARSDTALFEQETAKGVLASATTGTVHR